MFKNGLSGTHICEQLIYHESVLSKTDVRYEFGAQTYYHHIFAYLRTLRSGTSSPLI